MSSTHSPGASGPCEQVRRLQAEASAGRQTADCTRAEEFPEKLADLPGNFSNHLHFKGIGAPLLHGKKKRRSNDLANTGRSFCTEAFK